MPFSFLKYLNPVLYFSLKRKDKTYVFPNYNSIPTSVLRRLDKEYLFKSSLAKEYDLSWQAINSGYISDKSTYTEFEQLPLSDEYAFIIRNFHKVWSFYVLIIRLITLKNPFKEITSFFQSFHVKRVSYFKQHIFYDFENFDSELILSNPKVSVIIPTLNRYNYLKDILSDFEKQSYSNFELVIVDQSDNFSLSFYEDWNLDINLYNQKEKALWLARNNAINYASGSIIALSEDDVRIDANWVENHLKCLDYFNADISAGVFFPENSTLPKNSSFFKFASHFATGNSMLYKHVFKTTGLFDRQFERQRMGDGEFGLRAYLHNFISVSNPLAYCIDIKAPDGGLRMMGSWDSFRSKKFFAPKPAPSVLYIYRKYFGLRKTILFLIKTLPTSFSPYKFKNNKLVNLVMFIFFPFFFPFTIYKVLLSWNQSSKKLNEGDKIGVLK
tara:strand:- start:6560 stop:7885 length:1326 start_codon:yes stop_codon:yes gene_type:complete